jgi:hypothetical protein
MSIINRLMPTNDFLDIISNKKMGVNRTVTLLDVDRNTWKLFLNHEANLKLLGVETDVVAVAYDEDTCKLVHAVKPYIGCYYNEDWQKRLRDFYHSMTGYELVNDLHRVMLGRMMTSLVTVCHDNNLFLSDSDVVFFKSPLDLTFDHANIMITAIPLDSPKIYHWGATYLSDQPTVTVTLNNGVVFYKSSEVMKDFLMTLVINAANSLSHNRDLDIGFLQIAFNKKLSSLNLRLHPADRYDVHRVILDFVFFYVLSVVCWSFLHSFHFIFCLLACLLACLLVH